MVELLLPKSDAKATNQYGQSALILAARSGNVKSVELLLPFSDPKASSYQGTALDLANSGGHNQIVRLLKQHSTMVPVSTVQPSLNEAVGLQILFHHSYILSCIIFYMK